MSEQLINFREYLIRHGLKITPQRIAVYEAVSALRNHPGVDIIVAFVRQHHPNVSVGTVYNILDTFVEIGLISKVKTDGDIMRYDTVSDKHHHLYSADSSVIGDYYDPGLDRMLEEYFSKKQIEGFHIEDIKIQLTGRFIGNPVDDGSDEKQGKKEHEEVLHTPKSQPEIKRSVKK